MIQPFSKPYLTTAALIPIVLALGFIEFDKITMLNIYDTYFVVERMFLSLGISFVLLMFSGTLFFYDRVSIPVSRNAVNAYCALTLLALLVLFLAPLFGIDALANTRDELLHKSAVNNRIDAAVFFSCAAFVLTQLIFLIVLLVAAVRKILF